MIHVYRKLAGLFVFCVELLVNYVSVAGVSIFMTKSIDIKRVRRGPMRQLVSLFFFVLQIDT